jgi:hypothetical protein
MKTRQPLFTPVALSFLVAVLGSIVMATGTPANAATTTTTTTVPVSGTVSGGSTDSQVGSPSTSDATSTESVSFSGDVLLKADVVEDPDFGTTPIVLLSIDLSKVTGVGASSRTKYVTSNQNLIQRRLRGSDAVQFTFPFWPSGTTGNTTSRVGGVSFSLTFNTLTRTLTGVSSSITSP